MVNWLTYEFQLIHLKYEDCERRSFYFSQWSENDWALLTFKGIMVVYWCGSNIFGILEAPDNFWWYQSNWGTWTIFFYFIASFGVCWYGRAAHDSRRLSAYFSSTALGEAAAQKYETEHGNELRWFHKTAWILHTVALDIALATTALHYSLFFGPDSAMPWSVNVHAINTLTMLIDFCVVDIPVRLLHVVHTVGYSMLYVAFLLVLTVSGETSRVYGIVDWEENPTLAAISTTSIIVSMVIFRSISFALYNLKLFVARKTSHGGENDSSV